MFYFCTAEPPDSELIRRHAPGLGWYPLDYEEVNTDLTTSMTQALQETLRQAGVTLTDQVESKSDLLNASRKHRDIFTPTKGRFDGWTYPSVVVECEDVQVYEAIYIELKFVQYCDPN